MGILFLLFSSLIVFELLNLFLNLPPFTSGWVIIILVGLITIYSLINAFFVRTKNLEIPIKNLKNELKIVQISDIHLGTIRGEGYLKSLTHKINRLHPDFVVITGDLFDGTAPLDNKIFKHVDDLNVPVYFVTGNHETYEGLDNVFEILKTTKLKILLNEVTKFRDLQIIGVSYSDKRNYLKKALKEIKFNKTKPTILLYHIPVNPKLLNDSGIQLHLGGHTHGGQIFPFNLMVKLYFPHSRGLKKFKESYSYISQGTGTWGPPMRLGSKNEITLIKLKKN
jgi:predicted MPP superfamily phosphohydrolase